MLELLETTEKFFLYHNDWKIEIFICDVYNLYLCTNDCLFMYDKVPVTTFAERLLRIAECLQIAG